jgi:broad specificity phosphatase PhoE
MACRSLVLLFAFASVAAAEPATVKTFIVLRHAEQDTSVPGKDPPLSELGGRRAEELARVVGDTTLQGIFSTNLQRTQRTAAPLARRAGRSVTVVDDVAATVSALRAEPWGATVAVIGHSNTVGPIVASLSGQPFPAEEKVGYDQIWIVTIPREGVAGVLRLRYGPPPEPSEHGHR